MIVLGVAGWKRSGKDTTSDYLIKDWNYKKVSFADPLKQNVAEQFNLPLNACYDQALKEEPLIQFPVETKDKFGAMIHKSLIKEFRSRDGMIPHTLVEIGGKTKGVTGEGRNEIAFDIFWTPRALMILEGSSKRAAAPDYWVQQAIQSIKTQHEMTGQDKFVISDLRYRSELDQLQDAFGVNFVSCKIERFATNPSDDPSECDLDGVELDYTIDNRDSLYQLYRRIDDVVAISEGSILT